MNIVPDFSQAKRIEADPDSKCNTTEEVIKEQIAQNLRLGRPQIQPHPANPNIALLVCGGPSLAETEKELRDAVWRGGKIVACNGSYQWCIDRNLKPSAFAMLDAREFNSRFIETPVDGCKYLLASQCHPRTFELCKDREVLMWHCCGSESELAMVKAHYFDRTYPVSGGTTIGIRTISLLRLLGFQSIEIFGLDSCWMDDRHHSYEQPENNNDRRYEVWLRPAPDRDDKAAKFICAPWHMRQAADFLELLKERGDLFRLNIHGNGLLATMLRTGAELQREIEE